MLTPPVYALQNKRRQYPVPQSARLLQTGVSRSPMKVRSMPNSYLEPFFFSVLQCFYNIDIDMYMYIYFDRDVYVYIYPCIYISISI